MGTPARTSILLDLRTTLAGVATVVKVDDGVRPIEDVPVAERPYLGWATSLEIPTHNPFNNIRCTLPIVVVGYVTSADWATRSAAINSLADATIAALFVDPTRGGHAVMTQMKGMETNESDPDSGADGFFILDIEIVFNRTTSAS